MKIWMKFEKKNAKNKNKWNRIHKKKIKVIEDYGIDYNTLEILENADKILSIGSASKASYVLIGCTLSFVKVKFQPA